MCRKLFSLIHLFIIGIFSLHNAHAVPMCRALCIFPQPTELSLQGDGSLETLAQGIEGYSSTCSWMCESPVERNIQIMASINAGCIALTAGIARTVIPEGLKIVGQKFNFTPHPHIARACQLALFPALLALNSYLPEYPGSEAFSTTFGIVGKSVIARDLWKATLWSYQQLMQARN